MATKKQKQTNVTVKAPNFQRMKFHIRGVSPYVQSRFSKKMDILAKQEQGSASKSKKQHEARDTDKDYQEATYRGPNGEYGIPATAFRAAMISTCRLVGFQMTKAKLTVFIEPDFFDDQDGLPMVRIIKGEPKKNIAVARLPNGDPNIAVRPMWSAWEADVTVRWDRDQFLSEDVTNLVLRAGLQVGIGEGRPDSKKSPGCGWGLFEIIQE